MRKTQGRGDFVKGVPYLFALKGGRGTEDFAGRLTEELTPKVVFELPLVGGITESVVVMWIIMAAMVAVSILLTRNLRVENPGKVQLLLESGMGWADNFFTGIIGKENRKFVPWLTSMLVFLGVANLIPLIGFKPPTKDLNVTAALAILSMCVIEYSGIRQHGVKGWLKNFTQPVAIVTPIMLMEVVIRPLSLCMRLFGNMVAGFIIMELVKTVVPMIIPIPVSFYFDIFDGLLQAYVFVFLTALFIKEESE